LDCWAVQTVAKRFWIERLTTACEPRLQQLFKSSLKSTDQNQLLMTVYPNCSSSSVLEIAWRLNWSRKQTYWNSCFYWEVHHCLLLKVALALRNCYYVIVSQSWVIASLFFLIETLHSQNYSSNIYSYRFGLSLRLLTAKISKNYHLNSIDQPFGCLERQLV